MLLDKISNIPQEIFKFFTSEADRLGKETGFQRRRSKLTPSVFIISLIRLCFSEHFNLELFCSFVKTQKIYITKQSLHERFNERTEGFLKAFSLLCLKHFQMKKLSHLNGLEQFSSLNIIDSSTVSLHHALNKLFKGSGGAASSSAMKIQMMFDYLGGQIKEFTLTSGCNNDQGFDDYFKIIEKMHLDSIKTKKPSRVVIETYGKFIAMMLLFLLCNPIREIDGKQLSFYKACQQLSSRAAELVIALISTYRLKRFLNDFYENLSLFAIKELKKKPPLNLGSFEGERF